MREIDVRRSLPLHAAWIAGLTHAWQTFLLFRDYYGLDRLGVDAHAYWAAWQGDWRSEMYDISPGAVDAFNYSPAFALLVWPLAQLPWLWFGVIWTVACVVGLVWLIVPLGWRWVPPLLLCATHEIVSGNIFWALAIAAVVGTVGGSRWRGAAWSFVALAKLTPALGPIWYAIRREWGPLAVSVCVTVVVVGGTYLLVPELWHQWFSFLMHNQVSTQTAGARFYPPLVYRLPLGLLVVVWGARTGRAWTIPVGMVLASPVSGVAMFVLLYAIPRLVAAERAQPRALSRQVAAPPVGRPRS